MNTNLKAAALFTLVTSVAFTPGANAATLPAVNGPVQWSDAVDLVVSQGCGEVGFTVPKNKRLVIQYLSGYMNVDLGEANSFSVQTTVNGVAVDHQAAIHFVGPGGGFARSYFVSQPLTVYADPGTEVRINACDTLTGRAYMRANLSGRLYPKGNDVGG